MAEAAAQLLQVGPRNLITDVAGLRVGNAQEQALKSGVTVVVGEAPFTTAVDVRGGAPGTRETDLLGADKLVQQVDALVLAGGSSFGLDAASGVVNVLRQQQRGYAVGTARVPLVPAAILFDLLNGGDKDWPDNPYRELGRAACEGAATDFSLGSCGAGAGATTARLKGGLGSASVQLPGGVTVAALVAVNPHGCATASDAGHFWAAPYEVENEFGGLGCAPAAPLQLPAGVMPQAGAPVAGQNTTIGVIATDADLNRVQLQRLAVAGHDGIARAIVPAHTPFDGDLLFALATGVRPVTEPANLALLGHAASLCVCRAIARGVFLAQAEPGDVLPSWRTLFG